MGIFSIFFGLKEKSCEPVIVEDDVSEYLDNNFFRHIVDTNESMTLCFLGGEGWIWANKHFLEAMSYHDINDFKRENESIRDIFLNESEEIFTESDKSWLDYIKKYKSDGYRVSITSKETNEVLVIDAFCSIYPHNKNLYILELKDMTALHKAQLKIKEVEKLKTKFLANIGHEFRTPMNGILGFVELLKETNLDQKQLEYINMISKSSKSLMSNIEILLDLSQLQGGRLTLQNEEFNILPEMEELIYNFYKMGEEKGVKVLSFIDPKLPKVLTGDMKKILQIMSAITQNAVKFTPRGAKVIIEVKLLKRAQNGDCSIGFGVKDNGKGISEKQIAFMYEPFTAGNHADQRMGVGLSLSYGLAKLMGSELRINSEKESGTYVNFVLNFKRSEGQNFKMMPKRKVKVLLLDKSRVDEANFLTIYLRAFAIDVIKSNLLDESLYDDIDALYIVANQNDSSWMLELGTYSKKAPIILLLDEGERLQTKLTHIVDETVHKPLLPSSMAKHLYAIHKFETVSEEVPELNLKQKIKALVVEDNLINQRLIQLLLQEYDIMVATAANGLEAVDMTKKNKFDIIFMDIDMPEMNGIVATKQIKDQLSRKTKLPIVALTAMAMEGDREMLLSEGLDDYLSKPLTREKLESILDKYLKVPV
ncbi:response regulator [Sulfurimonas indica]|uniref:response regulator n=1 Tax=Sulfurimonas indica TaxID=2508707 RepID=UPI0012645D14|nr:response regulator [Sulfurimonas indica]